MKKNILLVLLLASISGPSFSMITSKNKFYEDCHITFGETVVTTDRPSSNGQLNKLLSSQFSTKEQYGIVIDTISNNIKGHYVSSKSDLYPYVCTKRVLISPDFIKPENMNYGTNLLKQVTEPVHVVCFSDHFALNHMEQILASIPKILSLTLFGIGNLSFAVPDIFWEPSSEMCVAMGYIESDGPTKARILALLEKHHLILGQNLFSFEFATERSNPWKMLRISNEGKYSEWFKHAKDKLKTLPKSHLPYTKNLFTWSPR